MRNLKKTNTKGFTLVELIVVMAIIGVLAAVLVPAMLGFMRDSRISQANQNAHTVYTSANSVLTKYTTANGTANTKSATFTGAQADEPAAVINITISDTTIDMGSYLGGVKFRGNFGFTTTASGDAVATAAWSASEALTADNIIVYTDKQQEDAYAAGTLIGFAQ